MDIKDFQDIGIGTVALGAIVYIIKLMLEMIERVASSRTELMTKLIDIIRDLTSNKL